MQIGKASGLQIAFFTFAALLLIVPVTKWIVRAHDWSPEHAAFIERFLAIVVMGCALVLVPPVRRWCLRELGIAVAADHRRETWIVALVAPMVAFAAVGFLVLSRWIAEGPAGLAQWVRTWPSEEVEMSRALTGTGFAMLLAIAILAPVVEELVFRGLLYRAWEEKWGWPIAMLLSSIVFAAYHPGFWYAFVSGLLYTALYRRTGSLLAPILAHGIYNASLWYPFLGRFVMPGKIDLPGDLSTWHFHLAALFACAVAVPSYLFIARHPAPRKTTASA
jgi:uncharacterized protein